MKHGRIQTSILALVSVAAALCLIVFNLPLLRGAVGGVQPGPSSTPESIRSGEAVFIEYCAGCHGVRADGRGSQALNLVPRPQNLRNAQFVKHLSDDRLFSSISGGVRGTSMPAFELMLTPDKRWNAIHYIRSLTADDKLSIPNSIEHQMVPPDAKNPILRTEAVVETGRQLFLSYCASCHGARGDGKGVIAASLMPMPRNLLVVSSWGEKPFIDYLTDARLYDSITNGVAGTSMSPWIRVMTDDERWGVITFLRAQADVERMKTDIAQ